MVLDARLTAGGLRDLAELLTDVLRETDDVRRILQNIGVSPARAIRGGTVLNQWQDALFAADDRDPGMLDKLLTEVDRAMKGMPTHQAKLRASQARGAREADLGKAVKEAAALSAALTAHVDPRDADALLQSLRSVILDIRDAFGDEKVSIPLLAVDAQGVAAARAEITGASRRTLAAVDNLLAGIRLAAELKRKRRDSDGEDIVFSREHAIVRVLIDDREAVHERAHELLGVLDVHAPAVPPPPGPPGADDAPP